VAYLRKPRKRAENGSPDSDRSASVPKVMAFSRKTFRGAARVVAVAIGVVGVSMPQAVWGLVVIKRDFPDLVARAEQIVIGTVVAVNEAADETGAPYTFVTFDDLAVLKGDVGSTLTLRLYGGSSGRFAAQVPDMPTFTPGDRAVLFVRGNGRDVCPLVGVWQGRFQVRYDTGVGAEIVADNDGRPLVGVSQRQVRVGAADGGAAALPMTLDQFRQHVANELATPSAAAGDR